jgi:ubiquinone/menaquinone biosynthesis C-methylase UbiE
MNKTRIITILRKLRLMHLGDLANFYFQKYKNQSSNQMFKVKYPDVVLPPDYMIYESFQMNYEIYYNDSVNTAKWLLSYLEKYIELKNVSILEWGCGPARIIRHLPDLLDKSCEVFGSDYNLFTIEWCKKNIPNVTFITNNLEPPLKFQNNFFNIIYANSVLTHLSEKMHFAWFQELRRISKKDGIIFLTTHGDNCKSKLSANELERYETGKIVIRGNVKEGHRSFAAYQPTEFMKKLFYEVEILEHVRREPEGNYFPPDIWIVRKK